eukprot:255959-Amphidinium_carterae.3
MSVDSGSSELFNVSHGTIHRVAHATVQSLSGAWSRAWRVAVYLAPGQVRVDVYVQTPPGLASHLTGWDHLWSCCLVVPADGWRRLGSRGPEAGVVCGCCGDVARHLPDAGGAGMENWLVDDVCGNCGCVCCSKITSM